MKQWLLDRLKEPSTQAGLSALGLLVGLPPGSVDVAYQVVAAGFAVAAIVRKEKGRA